MLPDVDSRLRAALEAAVPSARVSTRPLDRIAWAGDASFYRLVPRAVVHASSAFEVRGLLAVSQAHEVPLTFRAAGTSLSGQAITDGILVEVARGMRGLAVEDGGRPSASSPG